MKVVLLEDKYLLNNTIKEYLESQGAYVESYLDGGELLENYSFQADIVVLDIQNYETIGFEVIEWIKRIDSHVPTLFITASTDIESIKKGYALGCSNYLKKPFLLEELWLRIEQLSDCSSYKKITLSKTMSFDLENEQLYCCSDIMKLTKIQRKILKLLINHKNTIVTYEVLISEIWQDFFIKTNTIASHIKNIRRYIPKNMIESVRAEGYRLLL